MLKYSGAPLKMLLEVTEPRSSELTLATETPIYILNQRNTKVLTLFIARAGQTKTFDKTVVFTLFLNVAGILSVSEPQLSFLWCQAVEWLTEVNLPWRDLSEDLSLACIYLFDTRSLMCFILWSGIAFKWRLLLLWELLVLSGAKLLEGSSVVNLLSLAVSPQLQRRTCGFP